MVILAIDLGRARTGVAVCDEMELIASPVGTIAERRDDVLVQTIAKLAAERKAGGIVVGLPRNMDGTEGESAAHARTLAAAISEATGLPVDLWDERLTTVSAVIILEDYLRRRRGS